jgi:hypothetical protein
MASVALAADITPKTYQRKYNDGTTQTVNHPYGFWNNPTTAGRETYNYNNPQDYTTGSGPHGGYTTTTHKCRECHAVHRAAGKFKLLRADSRVEACDWCHGKGAGSGYNIQMDNDDAYTQEYNVGHTMGFGTSDGKYKAPDDTYPAYTPKYYMGGFSCIDCHSPHGNPQRIFGYNNLYGKVDPSIYSSWAVPATTSTFAWSSSFVLGDPGRTQNISDPDYVGESKAGKPLWKAGKWLLVKDPDVEIAWTTITPSTTLPPVYVNGQVVQYGPYNPIKPGQEIPDIFTGSVYMSSFNASYPVNKLIIDWERPVGNNTAGEGQIGYHRLFAIFFVSEFCADCHDGNAGIHTKATPLFSEDRAVRNDALPYDIGYGHDNQPRHCGRQMKFNPEDSSTDVPGDGNFGPHCRNCHRGSSDCSACHAPYGRNVQLGRPVGAWTDSATTAATFDRPDPSNPLNDSYPGRSTFYGPLGYRNARSFASNWPIDWDATSAAVNAVCSNDGFSWPHRTMGYMMLKDELFGLDRDGTEVGVGGTKHVYYQALTTDPIQATQVVTIAAHDLDSACLDCHNPNIWNATSYADHKDDTGSEFDDQLLLRGLP